MLQDTAGANAARAQGERRTEVRREARKVTSFPVNKVNNRQRALNRRMTGYDRISENHSGCCAENGLVGATARTR